jgi:hypothetical protein
MSGVHFEDVTGFFDPVSALMEEMRRSETARQNGFDMRRTPREG